MSHVTHKPSLGQPHPDFFLIPISYAPNRLAVKKGQATS